MSKNIYVFSSLQQYVRSLQQHVIIYDVFIILEHTVMFARNNLGTFLLRCLSPIGLTLTQKGQFNTT